MKVAFCGLAGSGKNTCANITRLPRYSFAASVKDAVSCIFSWNRDYLEGNTPSAREWREQVDTWWAKKLGIPNFSPRFALQHFGTEIMREHFHPDIWVMCLERRLPEDNFVVTDLRFPNEAKMLQKLGCKIIYVSKHDHLSKTLEHSAMYGTSAENIAKTYNLHLSEVSCLTFWKDYVIVNNSDLNNLEKQVNNAMETLFNEV